MDYLEFEKPIAELEYKLAELRQFSGQSDVDISDEIERLEKKSRSLMESIFSDLEDWQIAQLSRHPQRPYTLDYLSEIFTDFHELHGDRAFGDDKAIVGGLARIDGQPVMIIGHEKGRDTKAKVIRNFGMPRPEGYRKALRLMKSAEKFKIPVVTLIDTPGAYPGLEAEERGQGEAIARNLLEMTRLKVPIICVIIGEGASGGALGIGVGDRVLMMENTWYSVISPESCSSILWRSWEYKEQAAEALKLTAPDMKKLKLIDGIIKEPLGGAHTNREEAFLAVRKAIEKSYDELKNLSPKDLVKNRMEKYADMGVYK